MQSACPATEHSVHQSATVGAIGDIHLMLRNTEVVEVSAVTSLRNLARVLGNTSAVVSDLASVIPNEEEETINAVR